MTPYEKRREWARANPDRVRASRKRWQEKNPAKMTACRLAWVKSHPDAVRAIMRRHREARRAQTYPLVCAGCGKAFAGSHRQSERAKGGLRVKCSNACKSYAVGPDHGNYKHGLTTNAMREDARNCRKNKRLIAQITETISAAS
jgi:hypothetical protein